MHALEEAKVNLMTVSNVLGRGRKKGATQMYRGAKEVGSLLKKVNWRSPLMKILVNGRVRK
jgi:nitrogen regulatory protein PII